MLFGLSDNYPILLASLAKYLLRNYKLYFRTYDVNICDGNVKDHIETSNFTPKLMLKLFHVFTANLGSLKH